jgi:hypothetical protein
MKKIMATVLFVGVVFVATPTVNQLQAGQQTKEHKPPVIKLNVDKARIALLKLVEGDALKELEKHATAREAKRLFEHMASNGNKEALKSGKGMRYEQITGVAFIGDWGLVVDESRFYIVLESKRNIIWVRGVFEMAGEKEYKAVIKEVAIGYAK